MSRVGKTPIAIPAGVEVALQPDATRVKGVLGALALAPNAQVTVQQANGKLTFAAVGDSAQAKALCGTMRQLVNNMVLGVSKGFEKKLSLVGVGYKAAASGNKLNLAVGYSHPVDFVMPEGCLLYTSPSPRDS